MVEDLLVHTQSQTELQISELFSKFLKARRKKISWPKFQRIVLEYLMAAEGEFLDAKQAMQQSTKAEKPVFKNLLNEYRERMTLIRRLADAMVWETTNYYREYIDICRTNRAPGLITGKIGFRAEQKIADLLNTVHPDMFVLLHDITNCLRVGDLTIIRRGEMPLIVEVKMTERDKTSGRLQRQRERMERFATYLTTGTGTIDPDIGTQFLIPIRATDSYNWKIIEEVAQDATSGKPAIRDEQGTITYVGIVDVRDVEPSLANDLKTIIRQPSKTEQPHCEVASLHRNAYSAFRLIPLFC